VHFRVSCGPAVRADFDRAVALLHHMMYVEARATFAGIAEEDPACGRAHWGIAMTLFQPLWPSRPTPDELRRGAAAVRQAQALAPGTERERALVRATEAFYLGADLEWWTRIRRWAAAMSEAYGQRPDDIETAAFYALSQLAVAPVSDDRPTRQEHAAAVLLTIYERQPRHPGAIHYTIHASDVQDRAGNSIEIVRSYDDIAPSVPHALHMPTHIFVRLGAWPEVIEWNRKSAAAALRFPAGDAISHHYSHAQDYLVYAFLQQGADAAAAAVIDEVGQYDRHQGTFISAFHLAGMPARYAVERRAWKEASAMPVRPHPYLPWDRLWWPEAMSWFARGLGAVHAGDHAGAREAAMRMQALRDAAEGADEQDFARYIDVDRFVLAGWIAYADGDAAGAIGQMRRAAEVEATVEKHPVSPGALYPPHEALGDLLLDLGRPAEALAAFAASLERWPGRYHSLLGAARAARQVGDAERAQEYYAELLEVVGNAETDRAGVREAQVYVGE
jgi:tetratricopeptide (TPR) repeat protein